MSNRGFMDNHKSSQNKEPMKAIFITFNQANTERVEYILDTLNVRGFTFWEEVQGRGSVDGDPHRGTHTWPEMNSAIVTMVDDEKVADVLTLIKKLDKRNTEVGIRAFVWNIEQTI
jgi:nitrogen regulatory protein PII